MKNKELLAALLAEVGAEGLHYEVPPQYDIEVYQDAETVPMLQAGVEVSGGLMGTVRMTAATIR